ncbi:hypothetical protein NPIL_450571 [Nephila pilipes]|uniref:Uncharacterized protein n=1 Tax=Nephila pilipes TaxID=299642 RepID=A0A8X6TFZ8_NEPPI|nr:hypothetical protein NPIL_450571 [Nephila pilipes]
MALPQVMMVDDIVRHINTAMDGPVPMETSVIECRRLSGEMVVAHRANLATIYHNPIARQHGLGCHQLHSRSPLVHLYSIVIAQHYAHEVLELTARPPRCYLNVNLDALDGVCIIPWHTYTSNRSPIEKFLSSCVCSSDISHRG